jgi:hypothetical protein
MHITALTFTKTTSSSAEPEMEYCSVIPVQTIPFPSHLFYIFSHGRAQMLANIETSCAAESILDLVMKVAAPVHQKESIKFTFTSKNMSTKQTCSTP